MKLSWAELKQVLYIFLTISGIGMIVTSYCWMYSADEAAQLAALVIMLSGIALLFFGLVAYFCRDDWEIWS